MKNIFLFLILSLLVAQSLLADLRIANWNLSNPKPLRETLSEVMLIIKKNLSDIICFQGLSSEDVAVLTPAMKAEHYQIEVFKYNETENEPERLAIAFKDSFGLRNKNVFPLVGPKKWSWSGLGKENHPDNLELLHHRSLASVALYSKADNEDVFYVFTTHFGDSFPHKMKAVSSLRELINSVAGEQPFLLAGEVKPVRKDMSSETAREEQEFYSQTREVTQALFGEEEDNWKDLVFPDRLSSGDVIFGQGFLKSRPTTLIFGPIKESFRPMLISDVVRQTR